MSSSTAAPVNDIESASILSGAMAPVYSLYVDHSQFPQIISTSESDKQRLVDIDIIRSKLLDHVDTYDPTMFSLCEKYAKLHRELHNVLKESYRESQESSLMQLHWRDRWNVILGQPHCCRTGRYIAAFTSFLIFLTAVQFALETVPILSTKFNPEMEALWITCELVVTVFFTVEIIVRVVLERDKIKWIQSPMNVCDIVSVAPFFVLLAFGQSRVPIIKLVRLSRFFKLFRNFKQIDLLVTTLSRVSGSLLTPFLFLSICVLLIAAALFNVEGGKFLPPPTGYVEELRANWTNRTDGEGRTGEAAAMAALAASRYNKFWMEDCFCTSTAAFIKGIRSCPDVTPQFNSGLHTMWFAIVTMTTVGYGDFVPRCFVGKLIALFGMLLSSVFMAMPIAIVGVSFTQSVGEMNQTDRSRKAAMTKNIATLRRAAAAAARSRIRKRMERDRLAAEEHEMMRRQGHGHANGNVGGNGHAALVSSDGDVYGGALAERRATNAAMIGLEGSDRAISATEARLLQLSRELEDDHNNQDGPLWAMEPSGGGGDFRTFHADNLVRYKPRSVAEALLMHLAATLRMTHLDFSDLARLEQRPTARLVYTTALHHVDSYLRWILEGWLRQVCATTQVREPTIVGFHNKHNKLRSKHNELQATESKEVQTAQGWEDCVKTLRGLRAHETTGAWLPTLVLTSGSVPAPAGVAAGAAGAGGGLLPAEEDGASTIPSGVSPELTISRPSIFIIVCYPDMSKTGGTGSGSGSSGGGGGGGGASSSAQGGGAAGAGSGGGRSTSNTDGGMGQSVQQLYENLPGIGSVPVVLNLGEVTSEIHLPQQIAYLEVRKAMLQRELRLIPLHPVFHPISVNEVVVPKEGMEVHHNSVIDFSPFLGKRNVVPGDGTLRYQMKFDLPESV